MAELVKFDMLKLIESRFFQRVPRAVQRTAVHDDDALRFLRFDHQRLDATAYARETGHFAHALFAQPARNEIGEFPGVGAAGAGIDDRFGFFWFDRFSGAHRRG